MGEMLSTREGRSLKIIGPIVGDSITWEVLIMGIMLGAKGITHPLVVSDGQLPGTDEPKLNPNICIKFNQSGNGAKDSRKRTLTHRAGVMSFMRVCAFVFPKSERCYPPFTLKPKKFGCIHLQRSGYSVPLHQILKQIMLILHLSG